MKRKKVNYHQIKNLSQLRRHKKILSKKIYLREKLLKRRIDNFQKALTPEFVYSEFLKNIKMQDSILAVIPSALKLKFPSKKANFNFKPKKNLLIAIFSGLGAGITSMFAYKLKKSKSISSELDSDKQLFI